MSKNAVPQGGASALPVLTIRSLLPSADDNYLWILISTGVHHSWRLLIC